MAFQWAKVGENGAQREPGRFSSPGGRRYLRGGVWRRLPLPSLFEALEESSLLPALKSYFHPQPKSATANYTAINGERAARLSEKLRGAAGRLTSLWAEPLALPPPAPRPKPRGGQAGGEPAPARTRGRGERESLPHRPARRALPSGESGGAERGRRGDPASRTGARGPRTAAGGESTGRARLRVPPGRWGHGVSKPQAGLRRPPSQPLQRGQGRGSPGAGQQGRERDGRETGGGGGGQEFVHEAAGARRPRPSARRPHTLSARHSPDSCSAGAGPGRSRSGPR